MEVVCSNGNGDFEFIGFEFLKGVNNRQPANRLQRTSTRAMHRQIRQDSRTSIHT